MNKNYVIIALVGLALLGTIWGSVKDKKADNLERQLVAMRQGGGSSVALASHEAGSQEDATAVATEATAGSDEVNTQSKASLEEAATLKKTIASQKEEIEALKGLQADLDSRTAEVAKLKEAVAAAEEKLAAAEESVKGFEDLKATLANDVDTYSAKSQELAVEVEENQAQIAELEKALEDRTKLLVASGEELARTKLNMNVLLSKIAAQNNSLSIFEETRASLEQELAEKIDTVEELQHQLKAQVIVDAVIVEEAAPENSAAPADEAAPAKEAAPAN